MDVRRTVYFASHSIATLTYSLRSGERACSRPIIIDFILLLMFDFAYSYLWVGAIPTILLYLYLFTITVRSQFMAEKAPFDLIHAEMRDVFTHGEDCGFAKIHNKIDVNWVSSKHSCITNIIEQWKWIETHSLHDEFNALNDFQLCRVLSKQILSIENTHRTIRRLTANAILVCFLLAE